MRDVIKRFLASGEKAMAIPCASSKSAMRKLDGVLALPRDERRGVVAFRLGRVVYILNADALGVSDGNV